MAELEEARLCHRRVIMCLSHLFGWFTLNVSFDLHELCCNRDGLVLFLFTNLRQNCLQFGFLPICFHSLLNEALQYTSM